MSRRDSTGWSSEVRSLRVCAGQEAAQNRIERLARPLDGVRGAALDRALRAEFALQDVADRVERRVVTA
jgi:hypothetical protein